MQLAYDDQAKQTKLETCGKKKEGIPWNKYSENLIKECSSIS